MTFGEDVNGCFLEQDVLKGSWEFPSLFCIFLVFLFFSRVLSSLIVSTFC